MLLSDDLWDKLLELLRYQPNIHIGYIGNEAGVAAVSKQSPLGTRAQWRLLPSNYGHWNSAFKRFDR